MMVGVGGYLEVGIHPSIKQIAHIFKDVFLLIFHVCAHFVHVFVKEFKNQEGDVGGAKADSLYEFASYLGE